MLKYFQTAKLVRKLNARKYMSNSNDNAVQGRLLHYYTSALHHRAECLASYQQNRSTLFRWADLPRLPPCLPSLAVCCPHLNTDRSHLEDDLPLGRDHHHLPQGHEQRACEARWCHLCVQGRAAELLPQGLRARVTVEPNEAIWHGADGANRWRQPCPFNPQWRTPLYQKMQSSSCSKQAATTTTPQFAHGRQCDGYFTKEQFLARVPENGDAEQCNCMAHSTVFSTQYPSDILVDLKDLIRTPPEITPQDVSIRFIMALLCLFQYFDIGTLEVTPAGYAYVSYVLLNKYKRYHFSRHADYVILEDYYGARQILISTGEIQSTSDPDTPNSIYYMLTDHS